MLIWCAFILAFASQEPARPLPDAGGFRESVRGIIAVLEGSLFRATMHIDFIPEAAKYTYTEKETVITRDSKSGREKIETNVYDMTRGPEGWQYYRKLISKNGSALTDRENQEQDRKHAAFENSVRASLKANDVSAAREEQAGDNDLRAMFDIRVAGRDRIDGVPVVLLELKPDPKYKPKSVYGKRWQHVFLRVWETEDSHEVVRLIAELGDPYDVGFAVIEKGAAVSVERRLVNGEVWLPVRIEVTSRQDRPDGNKLTPREHVIAEFSDFKRFSVDVDIRPGGPVQ